MIDIGISLFEAAVDDSFDCLSVLHKSCFFLIEKQKPIFNPKLSSRQVTPNAG